MLILPTQGYILPTMKNIFGYGIYSFLPKRVVQYTKPMFAEDTKNIYYVSRSKNAISEVLCFTDNARMLSGMPENR